MLSRAFLNSPSGDAFFGFLLAAVLVGFGYWGERGEDALSGCMLAGVASMVGGLCIIPFSYLVGNEDGLALLVPAGMLVVLGWASRQGMPLWYLLGLLVWTGVSYSRFPSCRPGILALLLVFITALFIAVSGLRRKFPWLERDAPAPAAGPAEEEVHNPWER